MGKDAAIFSDVVHIINCTENIPSKAAEASCWLFAVSTGARAVTCSNILLSDIVQVTPSSLNNNNNNNNSSLHLLVQIRERVTKGNSNWNHTVTLEGDVHNSSDNNFVYWLERHLKKQFNLSLLSFSCWGQKTSDDNERRSDFNSTLW